ncbi:MAG: hypothetical protein AAF570_01395 [Bacteroidota bacterium]
MAQVTSSYKRINGVRYDRRILELADQIIAANPGHPFNEDDAKRLFGAAYDGGRLSKTEIRTWGYVVEHYDWNTDALKAFKMMIEETCDARTNDVLAALDAKIPSISNHNPTSFYTARNLYIGHRHWMETELRVYWQRNLHGGANGAFLEAYLISELIVPAAVANMLADYQAGTSGNPNAKSSLHRLQFRERIQQTITFTPAGGPGAVPRHQQEVHEVENVMYVLQVETGTGEGGLVLFNAMGETVGAARTCMDLAAWASEADVRNLIFNNEMPNDLVSRKAAAYPGL